MFSNYSRHIQQKSLIKINERQAVSCMSCWKAADGMQKVPMLSLQMQKFKHLQLLINQSLSLSYTPKVPSCQKLWRSIEVAVRYFWQSHRKHFPGEEPRASTNPASVRVPTVSRRICWWPETNGPRGWQCVWAFRLRYFPLHAHLRDSM